MICANCNTEITEKKYLTCTDCNKKLHLSCPNKCSKCATILCDVCALVNKKVCKTCAEKGAYMPDVIRRSHIELYKSCPYAFYKEVVEGVEVPNGVYAQVGIDLHELFNQYSCYEEASSRKIMIEQWSEIFNNYPDNLFEDVAKIDFYNKGITCIDKFLYYESFMPYPFATEETIKFNISDGLPDVQITMDRINEIDGELELVDYKTGKVMVGQKLSTDLQVPLYTYAVYKHYGRMPKRFRLLYLFEDKERVFERIDDDKMVCTVRKKDYVVSIQEALREVKTIFGRIKQGHFSIPHKPDFFACKMCHLRTINQCSGSIDEKWKQVNESRGVYT